MLPSQKVHVNPQVLSSHALFLVPPANSALNICGVVPYALLQMGRYISPMKHCVLLSRVEPLVVQVDLCSVPSIVQVQGFTLGELVASTVIPLFDELVSVIKVLLDRVPVGFSVRAAAVVEEELDEVR